MTRFPLRRAAAAALAAVLVHELARTSLRHSALDGLVVQWWLSSAVAVVTLLLLPRGALLLGAATTGGVVGLAAAITGVEQVLSVALALGCTLEVLLVVGLARRGTAGRARLASWSDFRRWFVAVVAGSLACASTIAFVEAIHHDTGPWRVLTWLSLTHGSALLLVLPLFVARESRPERVSTSEVALHLGLLAVGALLYGSASADQPVGYLLLPMLAWSASRFPPSWAAAELYAVSLAVVLASRAGVGPFGPMHPDASLVDMAASAQTFLAVAGVTSVTFVVAMGALRASLHRIREDEVRLGHLMESADSTAFVATDLAGVVTWFSPGAERLTGYQAEELVGRRDPLLLHDPREVLSRATQLGVGYGYAVVTDQSRAGEPTGTRDWTYVHRDGHRLTVSVSVTVVRDRGGEVVGHLSVVRDVTDRRAAEQALVQARDKDRETIERMRQLDQAKNDFVSAVSHELRTPLTSIIGYTELLRSEVAEALTPAQDHLVEKIDRNSERLLHLVEDLLTLARVEEGGLRVDKVPTDLVTAVRGAVEEMAHAARKGGVALELRLPERPSQVLLQADPHQLERLVLNLVGNAVKFTPAGGRVDVAVHVAADEALVEVADTGVGIPEAEQAQLFARFFRSSTATQNAIQGTGLGLSIVRSIAEAHGGDISFTSTPGSGTTFVFRVPVDPSPPEPAADAEPVEVPA
ncbi:sensor histidine kinase [Nocardioides aequoreus]|uniref:sensor histidine kinase n=1 Tax=Nocardioides aequoreus TaxID=397278 RepID=UPI00068CFEF5|nr:ATP-binding protein [Nocardioides aequoreus]